MSSLKELHADLSKTNLDYKNIRLLFLSQVYISENYIGLYRKFRFLNLVKLFGLDTTMKMDII